MLECSDEITRESEDTDGTFRRKVYELDESLSFIPVRGFFFPPSILDRKSVV